jgi:hypothetical protein
MATRRKPSLDPETLLGEILIDAYGDDEQLWALHAGIEDGLDLPMDVHVIGEPLTPVLPARARCFLRFACVDRGAISRSYGPPTCPPFFCGFVLGIQA